VKLHRKSEKFCEKKTAKYLFRHQQTNVNKHLLQQAVVNPQHERKDEKKNKIKCFRFDLRKKNFN
jgi:hypothetical protein